MIVDEGAHAPFRIVSAAVTHVGKRRGRNEDSVVDRPEAGLWAVADGMGGHRRGDHASAAIAEALGALAVPPQAPALMNAVRSALETINRALRREAGDGGTIASTVVCLLIRGGNFACVWAGDSRLYLIRAGQIHRLSRDHSVVQALIDGGALTPEEAADHPRANEVTRAIGAFDTLDLDIRQGRVQAGDLFVLCSDGLTKLVGDDEIRAIAAETAPIVAANALVETALERGGTDNVTVVAVRCLAEDPDTVRLPRRPPFDEVKG